MSATWTLDEIFSNMAVFTAGGFTVLIAAGGIIVLFILFMLVFNRVVRR